MLTELISPEYCAQQKVLHAAPRGYGGKGHKWSAAVIAMIATQGYRSVLDYGCGQGSLREWVMRAEPCADFREYDPAIPGRDALPEPADLVVCTDVLEHIEPEKLLSVLQHLKALAMRALLLVIATRPSNKTLTDGRNAHLILESGAWWAQQIEAAGLTWEPGPASPLLKPSREWVAIARPHAV